MGEVALGIAALPVGAPLLDLGGKARALGCERRPIDPFHLVGDDHRREPYLQVLADRLEIRVGEHDAAVARAWRPAVDVGRNAVQPDAVAAAALAPIPLVRVADRERA